MYTAYSAIRRPLLAVLLVVALTSCREEETARFQDEKERAVYEWLCRAQRPNGLLQGTEGVDILSLYEMACAAMAYTLYGEYDRAARIFDYYQGVLPSEFSGPSVAARGFIQHRTPEGTPLYESYRWLGDNSWLLVAINFYRTRTGSTNYDGMAQTIAEWIDDMQDKEGKELYESGDLGIWYGYNGYGNSRLHAKSTEGNLDAYVALQAYPDKHTLAEEILQFIDTMYVTNEHRLKIGPPDPRTDSELHAWAYATFLDEERYPLSFFEDNYRITVTSDVNGVVLSGFAYMPESVEIGRMGNAPTLEIIAAYHLAGDTRRGDYYLSEIEKIMLDSVAYPGTKGFACRANKTQWPDNPSDVYRIAVFPSAWYLFVRKRFNPLDSKWHQARVME